MKIVFLDTETTGLDASKHSIIQVAGSIVVNDAEVERFNWLVRPHDGAMVSQEALTINKRTMAEIRAFPTPDVFYHDFTECLGAHVDKYDKGDKYFFCGYNALFDYQFVRKFFERMGDQYFGSWFWTPPIDLMTISAFLRLDVRPKVPNWKLGTAAEAFGVKLGDGAHDAAADIAATRDLFRQCQERIRA